MKGGFKMLKINRKRIVLIIITLAFFGFGTSTYANNMKETVEKHEQLPTEIGISVLKEMLDQQKEGFKSGNPLLNSQISKLTETDEAVLLYYAMADVDKLPLTDFTYSIDHVDVYLDDKDQMIVEGYIIRNFIFGKGNDQFETSLGDNIAVRIDGEKDKFLQNGIINEMSKVSLTQNTAENKQLISKDEFLKRYQEEVDNDNQQGEDTDFESEIENEEHAQLAYTYKGSVAAYYALKYALNPNKKYKLYRADCTNFVSQALHYGGIPHFTKWKPYTNAWINAGSFRNYIRESGGLKMKTVKDTYANVKLGDVYHYDTRNSIFLPIPDGWMEHTAIVTSLQNKKILVSYHSNNRKNVPREYYTSVEGGKRYLSSIR